MITVKLHSSSFSDSQAEITEEAAYICCDILCFVPVLLFEKCWICWCNASSSPALYNTALDSLHSTSTSKVFVHIRHLHLIFDFRAATHPHTAFKFRSHFFFCLKVTTWVVFNNMRRNNERDKKPSSKLRNEVKVEYTKQGKSLFTLIQHSPKKSWTFEGA